MNGLYRFGLVVVRTIFPLCYHIEVEGKEHLPQDGGCLFVSNHRSNADPVIIGMSQPKVQFCFLAKQELFEKKWIGKLLRGLGAIAIDRGAGDLSPIQELIGRLKKGDNALIFPEGTRSKDGTLGRFKTGAALVAAQTGVPIIPTSVYFEGEKLHFRSKVRIAFGAPLHVSVENPAEPRPAELKTIKLAMTKAVTELLPPAAIAQTDRT